MTLRFTLQPQVGNQTFGLNEDIVKVGINVEEPKMIIFTDFWWPPGKKRVMKMAVNINWPTHHGVFLMSTHNLLSVRMRTLMGGSP